MPAISEEGGFHQKVSSEILVGRLCSGSEMEPEVVQAMLKLVENYFFRMGWLDPFELEGGRWQFTSFPASLAARSWLEVMGSPDGCWYPPAGGQITQIRRPSERYLEIWRSEGSEIPAVNNQKRFV